MMGNSKDIDWQNRFKSLPEIPIHKKWLENSAITREHQIVYKLVNNIWINEEESQILLELMNFYSVLYEQLSLLDYSSFSKQDLINFQNYILYAFNYIATMTNDFTIDRVYRLIVNEDVTNQNKRIKNLKSLKYPDIEIVKKIGKFNRSNTPNTNIFYSAENIDTALKERRPEKGKLISVGVWASTHQKTFSSYVIFHNEDLIKANYEANKAMREFYKKFKNSSPLLLEYMANYYKLLGREYSKKVTHHYEYIISALFSERLMMKETKLNINHDCIIYPSVGNNHLTSNIAIRPSVLNTHFHLEKVIEFEIEEEYYDKEYFFSDPEAITLAKIKNLVTSKNINKKGEIEW
ncbi:MAG: hypothetical protein C0448_00355 [Sphingobacteriaceae bacterium]|nr:hypothetical protein [Sphingobacteriaceae bacterium]